MSSLTTIGLKHYNMKIAANPNSFSGPGEIFAWIFCILSGATGTIIHTSNLDMDPCMRSFSFGFLGANLGIGWMYFAKPMEDWSDSIPLITALVVAGLILGLLMSEGDVQRETKEKWEREKQIEIARAKPAAPKDK